SGRSEASSARNRATYSVSSPARRWNTPPRTSLPAARNRRFLQIHRRVLLGILGDVLQHLRQRNLLRLHWDGDCGRGRLRLVLLYTFAHQSTSVLHNLIHFPVDGQQLLSLRFFVPGRAPILVSGRARLLPSRDFRKLRLSRSLALPFS